MAWLYLGETLLFHSLFNNFFEVPQADVPFRDRFNLVPIPAEIVTNLALLGLEAPAFDVVGFGLRHCMCLFIHILCYFIMDSVLCGCSHAFGLLVALLTWVNHNREQSVRPFGITNDGFFCRFLRWAV